jgi:UDP-2,3-diacylglucosamine pyrophosphatase LpxH
MKLVTEPRRYRSIWISDVHLGTKHCQSDALLEFLKQTESDHLYLVGDFIDGWELKNTWFWTNANNTLIQKLLRKNRKETQITYITGNHDEFVEEFIGVQFGSVKLATEAIHETADGRRLLVIHGHQFDGLTHFNRLLERIGSRLYQWILDINLWLNRVRRRMGFGYWSLASYLKFKAKSAVKFVSDYEHAMVRMAHMRSVEGIICGHIHRPEIKQIDGVQYLNCGDWVENCTALVEDFHGQIKLIQFHENENPIHSARRGTRPHDAGVGRTGNPLLIRS